MLPWTVSGRSNVTDPPEEDASMSSDTVGPVVHLSAISGTSISPRNQAMVCAACSWLSA